jgi:hypothetical protein
VRPSTQFNAPPTWLRHVTPWWLLRLINDHFGVCWSNVVGWKVYGSWYCNGWNPGPECLGENDYCGKFTEAKP